MRSLQIIIKVFKRSRQMAGELHYVQNVVANASKTYKSV